MLVAEAVVVVMAPKGKVEAVVLETDGSFSVITDGAGDSRSTLDGVNVPGPNEKGV